MNHHHVAYGVPRVLLSKQRNFLGRGASSVLSVLGKMCYCSPVEERLFFVERLFQRQDVYFDRGCHFFRCQIILRPKQCASIEELQSYVLVH